MVSCDCLPFHSTMFKMATPIRNKEGSCPGRLNLVTSKDRDVFLKAIHKNFIEKVDPLESGLMDELYACSVLTDTDTESLQGKNVNTRRDKARKLLIILTEIPFNDAANSLELPTYKKIISCGYNDEDLWAQIFQAFTRKPPDVSQDLSDGVTSIIQKYNFQCPENLHSIMSQGFPCECRKVDHVTPLSFKKVEVWLNKDATYSRALQETENVLNTLTPFDMLSETESRNTSTIYPNSSEVSDRNFESESTSGASNTTLHAESEDSEGDFEIESTSVALDTTLHTESEDSEGDFEIESTSVALDTTLHTESEDSEGDFETESTSVELGIALHAESEDSMESGFENAEVSPSLEVKQNLQGSMMKLPNQQSLLSDISNYEVARVGYTTDPVKRLREYQRRGLMDSNSTMMYTTTTVVVQDENRLQPAVSSGTWKWKRQKSYANASTGIEYAVVKI